MPFVTQNMIQKTADEFEMQWNFPNYKGAIDGKHAQKPLVLSIIIINPTSPYTFKQ
jgi:hypothetical protein